MFYVVLYYSCIILLFEIFPPIYDIVKFVIFNVNIIIVKMLTRLLFEMLCCCTQRKYERKCQLTVSYFVLLIPHQTSFISTRLSIAGSAKSRESSSSSGALRVKSRLLLELSSLSSYLNFPPPMMSATAMRAKLRPRKGSEQRGQRVRSWS